MKFPIDQRTLEKEVKRAIDMLAPKMGFGGSPEYAVKCSVGTVASEKIAMMRSLGNKQYYIRFDNIEFEEFINNHPILVHHLSDALYHTIGEEAGHLLHHLLVPNIMSVPFFDQLHHEIFIREVVGGYCGLTYANSRSIHGIQMLRLRYPTSDPSPERDTSFRAHTLAQGIFRKYKDNKLSVVAQASYIYRLAGLLPEFNVLSRLQ